MDTKVSILMLAYNHEKYIAQAIDSVLMQKTDFSWELVIGEDCSKDATRKICQAYQDKYPDRIRLLAHERNVGMEGNFFSVLKECQGVYLAFLEGDDYWVDPDKLQKQVDFLDARPEASLVFSRTEAFFQEGDRPSYEIPPPGSGRYELEGLLRNNFIATCSVMYRRNLVTEYPDGLRGLDMLDWPMHVLYAQHGEIGFINEIMAKYRIHANSNYSSRKLKHNYLGIMKFYKCINKHLDYIYCGLVYRMQAIICQRISMCSRDEKRWMEQFHYGALALGYLVLSCLPRQALLWLKAG